MISGRDITSFPLIRKKSILFELAGWDHFPSGEWVVRSFPALWTGWKKFSRARHMHCMVLHRALIGSLRYLLLFRLARCDDFGLFLFFKKKRHNKTNSNEKGSHQQLPCLDQRRKRSPPLLVPLRHLDHFHLHPATPKLSWLDMQ